MSNIIDLPSLEPKYDQASLWIARFDRGLSEQEEKEFVQWLNENPSHSEIFFSMARVWDKMENLSLLAEIIPAPKPATTNHGRHWTAGAIAASLLLVASLSFVWMKESSNQGTGNSVATLAPETDYQTTIGEQKTILLPDLSSLSLNTNTSVKVVFTENQRLIYLERGELHIEVAHDTSRPLSVIADQQIIQAVGTAFDVHRIDNEKVELLVTEGKVLVANQKKDTPRKNIVRLPNSSLAVTRGEKVILKPLSNSIEQIELADMNDKLSWRQGNIIFRGEPLEAAVVEFSRYSNKKFVIKDEKLKSVRVAGLFKAGDTQTLLMALHQNFSIDAVYSNDNQILLVERK